MGTVTAAGRTRLAAVAALAASLLPAAPVLAHSEGLTPYRYVVAPLGATSEGPAEAGLSTQALGRPGFAGTTDNQLQLTFPAGVLAARDGETGVRVQLDQLDPAQLPPLPVGLEPEGNGYRVSLTYAPSGTTLDRLAGLAVLGLTAPAPATGLYELVAGAWTPVDYMPVAGDSGFSSVVMIDGPGTFLQGYDPTTATAPLARTAPTARAARAGSPAGAGSAVPPVVAASGLAGLGLFGTVLYLRRRNTPRPDDRGTGLSS